MRNLDGIQPNQGKGNNDLSFGKVKTFAQAPIVPVGVQRQFKNFSIPNPNILSNASVNSPILSLTPTTNFATSSASKSQTLDLITAVFS